MKSLLAGLWIGIVLVLPAITHAAVDPNLASAKARFEQLAPNDRVKLQVMLTASGFWSGVPNNTLGQRLFTAIAGFQSANGFTATGSLTEEQMRRLQEIALPVISRWGFQAISHPARRARLWVPMGLGLTTEGSREGLRFSDLSDRIFLDYDYYPNVALKTAYAVWKKKLLDSGEHLTLDTYKPSFFALASRGSNVNQYIRFQNDNPGIIGFFLAYNDTDPVVHGDRLETLISASLWSSMVPQAPFMPLPPYSQIAEAEPATEASDAAEAEPDAPHPIALPTAPKQSESFGTGFFVSGAGHILTNAHVVSDCSSVEIDGPDGPSSVRVVARDTSNDLALLKSTTSPAGVAAFRTSLRLGEQVAAFGYPLAGVLSTSGNFTLGNVTALSGLQDDSRYLQISAPVQPGNSGGPLLDNYGNLVGVVSAKLNALKVMLATEGDIPQNVNFAIKGSAAISFLDSNGVKLQTGSASMAMAPADLADKAKELSVHVACRG